MATNNNISEQSTGMSHNFINLTKVNPNRFTFQLTSSHVAYANTLRRLCMANVKSVGFRADMDSKGSTTDVTILANSTPMTNEMLAHRIGLLPIYADPDEWEEKGLYEKYTFTLKVVNSSQKSINVTSSDFIVTDDEGKIVPHSYFKNSQTNIHDTCLIATLKPLVPGNEPEKIHIVAKASVGIGRENARYIPTCQATYAYTQSKDEAKINEAFENWLSKEKMVQKTTLEQSDNEKLKEFRREFNTLQIQRVYERDEITNEPNSFDFVIESVGPLSPEHIVFEACKAGQVLCEKYSNDLPESVVVQLASGKMLAYDFIFQGEDHTLGHLIQAWIDQNMITDDDVIFIGYEIPHPLQDEMVIRISVKDNQEDTARTAIKNAMNHCARLFEGFVGKWSSKPASAVGGKKTISRPSQEPVQGLATIQPRVRQLKSALKKSS